MNPVAIDLGFFKIHWYGLAYLFGILLAYNWAKFIISLKKTPITNQEIEKFLSYAILGIIIGGRLGHIVLYELSNYLHDPVKIFKVWEGGMSFHGGLIGVVISSLIFIKKNKIKIWDLWNLIAPCAPIALFFGRIANFVNAELVGKITDLPWGVAFFNANVARHPTQIYEALLEGLVLWLIINYLFFFQNWHKYKTKLSGSFAFGYGLFRIIVEFFKEPEYIFQTIDLPYGVAFSLPMVILGLAWIMRKN
jgi:phosphatidylglycerol:prolipoprotein diacylglycerol transferase